MLDEGRAETLLASAPRRRRLGAGPKRRASGRPGAAAVRRRRPAPAPRPARRLDAAERNAAIESALAALRPRLKADGGDCELVDVVDDVVRVRLTGACVGCQLASMTVLGVRMRLVEALGFPIKVVPV